ncbi:DUF6069 family protein [Nocardioides sp. T2.26MG-1]|uniref:DUF6069 family protein n=1 Tax=Nocardioides sp. T2.26MG-1 TaxID=3041166 RepID=UPI002477384D|nr:DUF6069 family protein [Nocardioides sp. T2.26MG-1]CAI9401701.1 hypothetical protein HIDPHFAB_00662 [Nocardioides sp. T2.26MG-1]
MDNLTGTRPTDVPAPAPAIRREAVVVVAAGTVAMLVWLTARAAGIDLAVRSGSDSREVGPLSVLLTALVVAAAGVALLRLLERRTAHGVRRWTVVAAAVWVLSFAGPLSATTLSAAVVLAVLHLLVGAVVLGGLRRSRVA